MSNTIKITARRKNRIENGMRADRSGSNPHSNGEVFSRLLVIDFIDIIHAIKHTIVGRMKATSDDIKVSCMGYRKLVNFLMIKSHMLLS